MTPKEGVCLCLVDLRQKPTFKILGLVFDLWRTKANNTFHYWVEILRKILPVSQIEEAKRDKQKYQELWEGLSEYLLIIDSAEQAIERPGNYQKQRKYYSGEKKIHTLKNKFRVLPGGEDIVDIPIGQLGKISDITLFRNNRQNLDAKQRFLGDKAYIGEEFITTAYKKPKKAEP
ncbi:transposase family protein [Trichormus azollae]|uniref:transposase family protein n=1 Tax=Trichormus azollae TaxID=1164 RepID=UPI00019575EF|nr:transposase family protein [Trichormus azollae]